MEIINNPEKKKRRKKKKRPPHKSKMITGYIIYASEIRKDVIKKFPDRDFGHISKLVGIEWKNLPQETKVAYEKRAQEANAKSKADAAKHFELKKLADAAEEKAKEHAIINHHQQQQQQQQSAVNSSHLTLPINSTPICNGYAKTNGHSNHYLLTKDSTPQSSQHLIINSSSSTPTTPLHIIQQQQQSIATNVQYCNNNNDSSNYNIINNNTNNNQTSTSQTPQLQFQRNNIVYRKPATVRLRPKEASTQTDPIIWVKKEPKKPLRFSQKFIDYLNSC